MLNVAKHAPFCFIDKQANLGSETVNVPKDVRQFVFGVGREGIQTVADAAGGNVEVSRYQFPIFCSVLSENCVCGMSSTIGLCASL